MKIKTLILMVLVSVIFSFSTVSAATIKGTITYEGKTPKFREIKMDADPICLTKHTSPVYPDKLILGEGNTMANVFVHVASGLAKKNYTAPTEAAQLDQRGCMYSPHILGVMVGQPINILNPDGTLHNVHAVAKVNKEFNIAMPKFRKKITRTFDKPELMVKMKCDVHPWMGAYVAVMEHPYFSVSQKDGSFEIADLPAGTYEIQAWHERLGVKKTSVTVGDGDSKEISFKFTKPGKK